MRFFKNLLQSIYKGVGVGVGVFYRGEVLLILIMSFESVVGVIFLDFDRMEKCTGEKIKNYTTYFKPPDI